MESSPDRPFSARLSQVEQRIARACAAAGRSREDITLMAVTKTHPLERIAEAVAAGLLTLGENRVQEAKTKIEQAPFSAQWELIGQLQSNKAKLAAALFARIQSVDREKLVLKLDEEGQQRGLPVRILMQVNTSEEAQKSGVRPEHAPALATCITQCPGLQWEGLMTIGPLEGGREAARQSFILLREIRDQLRQTTGLPLPVLSMGMTGDLEEAIQEGSTLIRIGTALFAPRP